MTDLRIDGGGNCSPETGRTRTIATMCRVHGIAGVCSLRFAVADGDSDVELQMQLRPHGDGPGGGVGCVSVFTETGANALFDALGEWLG